MKRHILLMVVMMIVMLVVSTSAAYMDMDSSDYPPANTTLINMTTMTTDHDGWLEGHSPPAMTIINTFASTFDSSTAVSMLNLPGFITVPATMIATTTTVYSH